MKKRVIAGLLLIAMLVTMMPMQVSAVTYISTEEITEKLTSWKSKLNGKYWNYYDRTVYDGSRSEVEANLKAIVDNGILNKSSATNAELGVTTSACAGSLYENGCRSNYFSGGWQCFGFAWWLEYALFQSTYQFAPNDWYVYSGSSLDSVTLQPGDLVRVSNHSIVVSDVSGGALNCVEAWGGSGCKISWSPGFNWSEYTTTSAMLTAVKNNGGTVYRYKYVGEEEPVTISSNITDVTMLTGDTVTITLTKSGHVENGCYYGISYSDDILDFEWLGWDGDDYSFDLTAHTAGTTTLSFALRDSVTHALIDSCQVIVHVAARSYAVSYNANGGGGAPSAQTKTEGVDLMLSSEIPYRFGYNFLGWALSSTATEPIFLPGDAYWPDTGVTLHAVWEATLISPTTTSEYVSGAYLPLERLWYYQFTPAVSGYYGIACDEVESTYILLLDASVNPIIGYDCGTITRYYLKAGQTYYLQVRPSSASSNYICGFTVSKASYITYNANGGSGAPSDHFVYNGTDVDDVISSTVPTRTGYTFCGWSTDPNATPWDYPINPGAEVEFEEDTTLYAIWTVNAAGVIYNANGGDGAPGEQWMYYGDTFELYGDIPNRFGYNFLGWGTSADATSATYQPNQTITLTGNLYLYALWEKAEILETPDTYTAEKVTGAVMHPYTGIYYQLECTKTANYMFNSLASGDAGNWLIVFDSSGNEIPVCGYNEYHDFWREYHLTAGQTYYIRVGGHLERGTYNFGIYHGAQITYDANGGDYAPDAHWIYFGTGGTLSTDIPWRDSYDFLGWATSPTATEPEYQPGDNYFANVDVTLYAVWEHVTYDLIYDLDGGTDGPESVNLYGEVTIPNMIPEKLGFNFLGWTIGQGNIDYFPGDTIFVDGDLTLWAVWEENYTDNLQWGSAASHTAEVIWPGVGQYYTFVPYSTDTYRIADMTDENVRLDVYNKSGTLVASSEEFVYISRLLANQTYYLRLYFVDTSATGTFDFLIERAYTVTYNANGGSGAPASSQCYHASGMTVSTTIPTRSGYTFLGWSEYADAEAAEYAAGDNFLTSQDTTLYAVWALETVTVTYNANGGENAPAAQEKQIGADLVLTSDIPTRDGYTFCGWATSSNAAEPECQPGDTFTLDADTTLYAVWKVTEYTITFDANGGENAPDPHPMGSSTWYDVEAAAPHRLGYTFLGWSTDPNAVAVEYSYGSSIKVQSDITLYAVWKTEALTADAVNSAYSVETYFPGAPVYFTFIPAENSHYRLSSSGSHDTKIVICDAEGAVLASDDNSGTDGNFWIVYGFEAEKIYYIRIDITDTTSAYASATLNQRRVYTITYDMNDNSGVTELQYKEHSGNYTVSEAIPTRTGYVFLGWATTASATTAEYQPGDPYTANADVTLYAVWEQEETVLYGDVNSDGKVNAQDRMYLTRYLAGMTGYTEDMIDLTAADVNCDGVVNPKDRLILTRFLAQWTAYPELPYLS